MNEIPEERAATGRLAAPELAAVLREANEQLVLATVRAQAAEDELRETARHQGEFLAMLGHELRNPLAPIRNAAEVLHRVAGEDRRVAWIYDVLVRQVTHLSGLVDDLVDISLISRGKMELRVEPVDVGVVIAQAVDAVDPLVKRKHHHLRCEFPREPAWVEGDAIRLTEVFENLLTHAAKYTQDGGEILLKLEIVAQSVVIRVRDNGLGLTPGTESPVELFAQDARAADRSEGRLGIGLTLARHLVELHRGVIEARGEGVDKGTEFVVRLPLRLESHLPVE